VFMVSASEAFDLARSGNRDLAVKILKQEFQKLQAADQKVELCEWIASCFENLQDYGQAAEWYEMAGALSISQTGSSVINGLMALGEYEKALTCYELSEDDEAAENCLEMIRELRHSYAAS
jgi:tetratricopeptide (TPR) repeat protein